MSEWETAGEAGASAPAAIPAPEAAAVQADTQTLLGKQEQNAAAQAGAGSTVNAATAQNSEAADGAEAQRQSHWQDFVRNQQTQHGKEVQEWRRMTANDPELGGNLLPVSVARAQWALNRFDPEQRLGQWMEESGLGNHPEVIRFFNRIADAVGDDVVVDGRVARDMPSLEERMYPNWKV